MKKMKQYIRALLPVAVALILGSCSSDDELAEPTTVNDGTKTTHVTISVGMDDVTRATVDANDSTLYFQEGDKLAVTCEVSRYKWKTLGLLSIKTIAEDSKSAIFEGDLEIPEYTELYVHIILVGKDNVGVNTNDGKEVDGTAFWEADGNSLCVANGNSSALNEAVKKYSFLSAYGNFTPNGVEYSFTLTQWTRFLNYVITLKDGTAANTELPVTVLIAHESTIDFTYTGTVTTKQVGDDVVANFVVPIGFNWGPTNVVADIASKDRFMISNLYSTHLEGKSGKSYKIEKTIYGNVQLWDGGPYWATKNIGAETILDGGLYFAWGETDGYTIDNNHEFELSNYRFANLSERQNANDYHIFTKYCNNPDYGFHSYTDVLKTLEPGDDAATANCGSGWRMPTYEEFQTLTNEDGSNRVTCQWFSNYKYSGVAGCLFTGNTTGYKDRSIFLPAAGFFHYYFGYDESSSGFYWSSSFYDYMYHKDAGQYYDEPKIDELQPYYAHDLCIGQGGSMPETGSMTNYTYRYQGLSVRPVRGNSLY